MVAKKRSHKTQVLILQMYQGSELGSLRYDSGMIRAWFGVWFGNPFFFEFGKLCCLSLFFPPSTYYDCYFVNGCNDSTCQTTLDRIWIWRMWRSKCTSMIYIRRPAGVSSGCSSHVRIFGLVASSASQPQPESSPSSVPHWQHSKQPATQPATQPVCSNWASHLASQPVTQSQPA